jgi:hypothetical protein
MCRFAQSFIENETETRVRGLGLYMIIYTFAKNVRGGAKPIVKIREWGYPQPPGSDAYEMFP